MGRYDYHVFVCCNNRGPGAGRPSCGPRGGIAIREAMKAAVAEAGMADRVRVNVAGCLDHCEHGPTVVVYPEQTWYGFVRPEDVPQIVAEHLGAGRPVERLRLPDSCINTPSCPHRSGGGFVTLGSAR